MHHRQACFVMSCMALVAFFGISASAFALVDPACDGEPYNNDPAIHEFSIGTPDSPYAHDESKMTANAVICGTELTPGFGGESSRYETASVSLAPGVEITNTANIPVGSYTGKAFVNLLYHGPIGTPYFAPNVPSTLRVDRPGPLTDCPADAVACHRGSNFLGHNWSWTTVDQDGNYKITIGKTYGLAGIAPGITYINLEMCKNFGQVNGSTCGSSSNPVIQYNGDPSALNCPGRGTGVVKSRNGIYTARAKQYGGTKTRLAMTCVPWYTSSLNPISPQ